MTVFNNTKDRGIQISQFYQDRIFAGGSSSCFSVLSYNDELLTGIESSSNPVYSCNIITPKDTNKVKIGCCFMIFVYCIILFNIVFFSIF